MKQKRIVGWVQDRLLNLHVRIAECVSGILLDHGMVLVEKRRADDDADPGFVMLPGGHVEGNESLEHALKREMREELGIQVKESTALQIRYHIATDGEKQRVHYFHVKKWSGTIKSEEAERVYWEPQLVNLSDLKERKIVQKLIASTGARG